MGEPTTLEKCVDDLLDQLEASEKDLKRKQEAVAELVLNSLATEPTDIEKAEEQSEISPSGGLEAAIKAAFPSLTDEQIEDWLQVL